MNQRDIVEENYNSDEQSVKEFIIKVKDWIIYLKSKFVIIITAGIIGGLIGFIVAFIDKPLYKATLTFAMEEEKGGGGLSGAIGLASSFGIDLGGAGGGGAFAASNLTELMKSRLIVEKVLLNPIVINGNKTTLIDYYIKIYKFDKKWSKISNLKNINFYLKLNSKNFNLQEDSILHEIHKKLIEEHISIMQKDKKVTILSIDVLSNDQQFSKIFCESIAKETSDFYIETKSKKARINAEVLQKQVDSVRKELNEAINGVAKEADNVYNLNPALNIKGSASKKKQIDVQANTAILTNLVVQSELAKITLRKETPLIQIIDQPALPLNNVKLGKFLSLLFGAFAASIAMVIYLISKQLYRKIMK